MLFWAAFVCAGLALMAHFAKRGWPLELAAHWRPQIAATGLGLAAIGFVQGEIFTVLTALGAAGFASAGVSFAPVRCTSPKGEAERAIRLTLVFCNVMGRLEAAERVARLARAERADLVCLAETPDSALEEAPTLFAEFPHRLSAAAGARAGLGLAVFARRAAPASIDEHVRPILRLRPATRDGRTLSLTVLHAPAPFTPKALAARDAYLAHALRNPPGDGRWIAIGDYNLTPWSPAFAALPGRRAGEPGKESTWLTDVALLGLPIDHALIGPALRLIAYRVGPFVGSDHRPLILTVALA